MDEPQAKKSYWVTFRVSVPDGVIEGDMVAEVEKLNQATMMGLKTEIVKRVISGMGGTLIPNMGEPVFVNVIRLDD